MDNLTQCPVPPFWAIFEELAEQGVCDASEFSNKEIAETVALLSTDDTMSPLSFDLSYMLSMVLGFLVLLKSSLLSSPSNLMWLMTSVLSTLYKFILEPYITFYKLVGPGNLSYIAFETFSIFLFIVFCCLYRGSVIGSCLTVRFLSREAAESITGVSQLKECIISISAWGDMPFNRNAMIEILKKESTHNFTVPEDEENRIPEGNTRIMTIPTICIGNCKMMARDLCASIKWTHTALALVFALIIQIPAVSANAQLIPGSVYQCFVSAAGFSLICYRYMEAAVIAKAQLMPENFNQWLFGAKELFLSHYRNAMANFSNTTASLNEKFRQEIRAESYSTKEVDGEYEVIYDSEAAARARFRFGNKIVRGGLWFLFQAWFGWRFVPLIIRLLQQRYR